MSSLEPVLYGAYGRLADVLPALCGVEEVWGAEAKFHDIRLRVQAFEHIPDELPEGSMLPVSPRKIVGENFTAGHFYTVEPKIGSAVLGEVFELSPEELAIVREEYNLAPDWFKPMTVTATLLDSGEQVQVQIDGLGDGQQCEDGWWPNTKTYPPRPLIAIGKTVAAAELVRASYLARQAD